MSNVHRCKGIAVQRINIIQFVHVNLCVRTNPGRRLPLCPPAFDFVVSDAGGVQAPCLMNLESVGADALHCAACVCALTWVWGLGSGVRTNVISVSGWVHGKEKGQV